jgi:Na+:H+ antiporter
MMITFFDLFALLLLLTAVFGWLNAVVFKLPSNIGLLLMGLCSAVIILLLDIIVPGASLIHDVGDILRKIDFYDVVMHGMLAFLLFAGALHVDWQRLRRRIAPVLTMATVGVVTSTMAVGFGLWALSGPLRLHLTLGWALVFGALISPTDPVAVLSMLKQVKVPELLETEIAGESLFNDGVGVVLFTMLLQMAQSGDGQVQYMTAVGMFVLQALGGALFGVCTGWVAFQAMRKVDDYVVEVLLSLALATVTYAVASKIHISGPIAVVAAGLLIGERGLEHAMSESTQRYMSGFWTLVDEVLNSILFLLIGLELIVIGVDLRFGWLAICVIPLVLLARSLAVALPIWGLSVYVRFIKGTIPVLIWGGVRGGISIALALSLPLGGERPIILTATYAVVLFTIVVQGLTLKTVIRRTVPSSRAVKNA